MSKLIGIDTPARLLREQWGSPVDLAQELYAMFTATGPTVLNEPLTIRVPDGKTALRIERAPAEEVSGTEFRHSIVKNAAPPTPAMRPRQFGSSPETDPRRHFTAINDAEGQAAIREGRPARNQATGTTQFRDTPLVEFAGPVSFDSPEPVRFNQSPVVFNPRTGKQEDLADAVARKLKAPQSDDLRSLFGKVVAGTGNTYQVALFPDGPGGAPGKTVTVQIPYIAPDETIDPDTWLAGIQQYNGNYWCQPPVWMP